MSLARSSPSERVVVGFLLLALLVLGWIHLQVLPGDPPRMLEPFDLVNPMLDAVPGECLAIESETQPGVRTCVRVVEPALVVRPDTVRTRHPLYGDLSRSAPYLVCHLRYPMAGKGCSEAGAREELELYDLGGFGMPKSVVATLDMIRPIWAPRGGRYRYVYEVQLTRYGQYLRGPLVLYVDPAQPVTGVVLRREAAGSRGATNVIFTPVEGCGP